MNITLKNKNLSIEPLILLFIFYWFYSSMYFGYFLSKIVYSFLKIIKKNKMSKCIQLRKKLHLKNLIKTIITFCWKFFQNWIIRIWQKYLLLIDALDETLKAIQTFFEKVLKKPLKFKRNFKRFILLLKIL